MSKLSQIVNRIADRLTETFERSQTHDRDHYVEQSLNPREASQRIHRLEQPEDGLRT